MTSFVSHEREESTELFWHTTKGDRDVAGACMRDFAINGKINDVGERKQTYRHVATAVVAQGI